MSKLAKVEGEVIVKDGTGHAIEFYEQSFILDDAVKTAAQARLLIKKGLITERLRKSVTNFKRVRTCQVVEFTSSDAPAEQSDMDKLFLRATELNCVPENIDNYKRPDFKEKALQKAIALAEDRIAKSKPDAVQDLGYVD
jgi:hypothetical protein